MKKLLISFSLIVVMLMCFAVPTLAVETQTAIVAKDVVVLPGSEVTVNITVSNNPGIVGCEFTLKWDERLTLKKVESGEAFAALTFTPPASTTGKTEAIFIWDSMSIDADDIKDGVILSLTFEVDVAVNDAVLPVTLSYTYGNIQDMNDNPVAVNFTNGSVTVISYTPGDVNSDGRINANDVRLIRQYISDGRRLNYEEGYNVYINELAADATGDGVINTADITRIRRYISDGCIANNPDGYCVELFPSPLCKHISLVKAADYKAPSCTEAGNIDYWKCDNCGKYYQDEEAKYEIRIEDTVINATGHTYSNSWSTDENAHWHSAICGHNTEVSDYSVHSFDEGVCTICAYTQIPTYTVTFVDYNNSIIDIQEVQEGLSAVAPEAPTRANYAFMGWDTSFANVSGDITVKATYIRQYTVKFVDYDGAVLKTQVVNSGSAATAPSNPSRTGYDFDAWDKAYTNITANTTVTALYKIKTFEVTFKMPDGTVIPYVDYKGVEHTAQTVEYGSCAAVPTYSDVFTELHFDWNTTSMKKFSGWSKDLTNITTDTVVTAEYNDYYDQPVIAIEQSDKILSVKIYMPEGTHLYALDFAFDWTGSIGISNYSIDETSNVLYLTDNISKSIDYNNKQKTFNYSWTCAKGVKVPNNDEYFDVVEITFSTSGGSQLDAGSIQKDCTLVFGATSDLPIEQLVVINPIVVIK